MRSRSLCAGRMCPWAMSTARRQVAACRCKNRLSVLQRSLRCAGRRWRTGSSACSSRMSSSWARFSCASLRSLRARSRMKRIQGPAGAWLIFTQSLPYPSEDESRRNGFTARRQLRMRWLVMGHRPWASEYSQPAKTHRGLHPCPWARLGSRFSSRHPRWDHFGSRVECGQGRNAKSLKAGH